MSHFQKIATNGKPARSNAKNHASVIDQCHGLMWSAKNISDDPLNFADANKACEALTLCGFSDWRLPTAEELLTLVDRARFNPAIDTDAFPTCDSRWYWTSTVGAESPSVCAWDVNFYDGSSLLDLQDDRARVRAVRSVLPSASGQ